MNKKSLTKLLALAMAIAMLVTILTGCGTSTKDTGASSAAATQKESAAGQKADTSPITFDWFCTENYVTWAQTWGNDIISKYIIEKTGVNINFIIPADQGETKYSTMIASNSLPDFVTAVWSSAQHKQAIAAGQLLSLQELSEKYEPGFMKVADPDVLGYFKQDDGNTYLYPDWPLSPAQIKASQATSYPALSNEVFRVKQDIYEAIGKPDMRTPEGFLQALRDAKAKFPTIDGKPLLPFRATEFTDHGTDGLQNYLCDFLAIPYQVDGKVIDRLQNPEWVRWMKTFRQAASEGLITPDFFTDNLAQYSEKELQGRYFAIMAPPGSSKQQAWENGVRYIPIDGPRNSRLDPPTLNPTAGLGGWLATGISKNCKNQARAIKFITYMLSDEGQIDFFLGKKGVTWDTIDGKDQFLPEVLDELKNNPDAARKKYGTNLGNPEYFMLYQMWNPVVLNLLPPPVEPQLSMINATKDHLYPHSELENLDPPADSPEGIIRTKIDSKIGELLPKLINAKSDAEFDTLYNNYIKEANELGLQKLLDYKTSVYQKQKAHMGIK